jgi:hypothetical protein
LFTQVIADEICRRLALGETLRQICKTPGMPAASTVCGWASDERRTDFSEQYARARTIGLDAMAEEIIDIADTPQIGEKTKETEDGLEVTTADMIDHRRLRVDSRKWLLSKMRPEKYGDFQPVEAATAGTNVRVIIMNSGDEPPGEAQEKAPPRLEPPSAGITVSIEDI